MTGCWYDREIDRSPQEGSGCDDDGCSKGRATSQLRLWEYKNRERPHHAKDGERAGGNAEASCPRLTKLGEIARARRPLLFSLPIRRSEPDEKSTTAYGSLM